MNSSAPTEQAQAIDGTTLSTRSAIHILGQAAYNMSYSEFRAALALEDDEYARDKYTDLKDLARALRPFTDAVLTSLAEAYVEMRA